MDESYWNCPLQPGSPAMNWTEIFPGTTWQVLPASGDPLEPQPSMPAGQRNKNSIGTKCLYSDFRLTFKFRCPNMRSVFQSCSTRLKSPQNWGNSGVKILDANGYEVQIMDSHGLTLPAGTNPMTVITGSLTTPSFTFCNSSQAGKLMLGDICGAIYHTLGPLANPVYAAVNKFVNGEDTYVPLGEWNTMAIEFMSARYRRDEQTPTVWEKTRCSTINVVLNDVLVQDRVGLEPYRAGDTQLFDETSRLVCDTFYDQTGMPPMNFCKASGIVLFQEHDTYVQFQYIEIDPTWQPMSGGNRDLDWQRSSSCLRRAD